MGFRLGFILFSIFFLTLFLLASFIQYNRRWQEKFDIKNHFPYEVNYGIKLSENIYGNIAIILMALTLGAFYATMDLTFSQTFLIPSMVAGIAAALVMPLVVLVPLSSIKGHIAVLMFQILSSITLPGTVGIAALKIYQEEGNNPLAIIVVVCSFIVVALIAILMFNPNLSLKMNPEVKINEKGEKEYVRPRWIQLAFTEWMLMFSVFLSSILLFLLLIIF